MKVFAKPMRNENYSNISIPVLAKSNVQLANCFQNVPSPSNHITINQCNMQFCIMMCYINMVCKLYEWFSLPYAINSWECWKLQKCEGNRISMARHMSSA